MLALPLDLASAKVRAHGVSDDAEDLAGPWWAGLLPVRTVADAPIPDPDLRADAEVPAHVRDWHPR